MNIVGATILFELAFCLLVSIVVVICSVNLGYSKWRMIVETKKVLVGVHLIVAGAAVITGLVIMGAHLLGVNLLTQ